MDAAETLLPGSVLCRPLRPGTLDPVWVSDAKPLLSSRPRKLILARSQSERGKAGLGYLSTTSASTTSRFALIVYHRIGQTILLILISHQEQRALYF